MTSPASRSCEICEPHHPARPELESFIRDAFARRHGARINSIMPTLAALREASGKLCSVAGWRSAAQDSLYLESYLDHPVETALSRQLGTDVGRQEVVEVGNLASGGCRAARHLVALLPNVLLARGHRWVVFTATAGVRRILESLEAPVLELAPAVATRVAARTDDWGRYYTTDPRVMAGYLPDGEKLASALSALTRDRRHA